MALLFFIPLLTGSKTLTDGSFNLYMERGGRDAYAGINKFIDWRHLDVSSG